MKLIKSGQAHFKDTCISYPYEIGLDCHQIALVLYMTTNTEPKENDLCKQSNF